MNTLLKELKPGDTIFTTLRHVSKSGMTRDISCHVIKDNEPYDITYAVADLLDNQIKNNGVRIGGAGQDMGFHLVYNFSRRLFPNGFGEQCSNPNCNYRPSTKEEAETLNTIFMKLHSEGTLHGFSGRNGDESGWDNDGGYALNHRWL